MNDTLLLAIVFTMVVLALYGVIKLLGAIFEQLYRFAYHGFRRLWPGSVRAVAQAQTNPSPLEQHIHDQLDLLERSIDEQQRLVEQWIARRNSFWREFEQGFANSFALGIVLIVVVAVVCLASR